MQLTDSDARMTACNNGHHAASYECLRLSGMDGADSTGDTTPSKHDAESAAALVDDHSSILHEVHRRPRRYSYSSNQPHASENSGASTPTASTSTCLSRPRSASREAERAAAARNYKSRLARVDRVVLLDHEQEGRLRILTLEEDIVVHYLYPYYQLLHERLRECQSPSLAGLRTEQASVERRQSEPLHGLLLSCHRSLQGDAPRLSVAVPSVPISEHSNLSNVSERAVMTVTAEAQAEEGVCIFSPSGSRSDSSTAVVEEKRTATPARSPATGRESAASASPGGCRSLGDADQDSGILMSEKVNARDQPAPEYRRRDVDGRKGSAGAARASEGSSATRGSSKPRGPLLSFISFTRQVFLRTAEIMWLEMYHHGEDTPPASALPDLTDQMGKREEKEEDEEEKADMRVAEDALPGGLIGTLADASHEGGVVADAAEPRRGLHAELSRAASESAERVGETLHTARFHDGDDSSFSAANSTMSLLHTSSLSCADSQRTTTESASAGSSASRRSSSFSSSTSIDVVHEGQSTRTGNAVGLTEEDVAVELAASTLSVAELAATCVPRSASAPFDRLGLQQERVVGVAAAEEQHGGRHDDARIRNAGSVKPDCVKGEEEVSNRWLCAAPSPNSGASSPVKNSSPATSADCGLASAAHDSPSPRVPFKATTYEAYQDVRRGVSGNSNARLTLSQQHSLHVTRDGPPSHIRHSPSSQQHHGVDHGDGSSDHSHSALVPRHTQQPTLRVGVSSSPSHFHELRTPSRDRSYATSSLSATPCFVGSLSALQAEESVRRAELQATEYYEWSHYLLPASVGNGL